MIRQNEFSTFPRGASTGQIALEPTSDLDAISGQKILVLLDEQNLSGGASNLGCELDFGQLAVKIRSVAHAVDLHLFIAAERHDRNKPHQFEKKGYRVHVKTIRRIPVNNGHVRCDGNIDNHFAFWAGIFASRVRRRIIILGSGDFGLAGDLAEQISKARGLTKPEIMTLSLPGSTAQGNDARKNPFITANLEIGMDVLRRQRHSGYVHAAGAPGSYRAKFSRFYR